MITLKKNYLKLLVLGVSFVLLTTACGGGEDGNTSDADSTAANANGDTAAQVNDKIIDGEGSNQDDKASRPSPLRQISGTIGQTKIDISYSAPSVKNRVIWGQLVPYQEVWRTGANEATTIEFSTDVLINNRKLAAGKYGLFTIPTPQGWVVIFNKIWDQWGAFKYDDKMDVLRVKAIPAVTEEAQEQMSITIGDNTITIAWENLAVPFSVVPDVAN